MVGLGFFCIMPSCEHTTVQPLQAVSTQLMPVLSQGLSSEAQVSASSLCPHWQTHISGWGTQASGRVCEDLSLSLCSSCCNLGVALSSEPLKLPFCAAWSFHQWGGFPVCKNLTSFPAPSQGHRSHPTSSVFFLVSYLVTWRYFLPF